MDTKVSSEHVPADARERMQALSDKLGSAGSELEARLADTIEVAEAGLRRADASLQQRSDRTLSIIVAFSTGAALGLLLGGANRLVGALALVPAALAAGIWLDRVDHPRGPQDQRP